MTENAVVEIESADVCETIATEIESTEIATEECVCYPTASLMLEISKDEYSKERERANSLDNKSGIFISAIIALMALYVPVIPFGAVKQIYQGTEKVSLIATTVCLCVLGAALVFLILSFLNLSKAISLKPFQRVSFENLNDEEILSTQANIVERGLLDHYNTILVSNAKINDDKAEALKEGLKNSVIAFILLIVAAIGLLIIAG